jgi:hypothetical protein|tara:strand:- start:8822 stop:9028 length:207 start_codon:yes stop_codon:yes gene_type:complete
MQYIRDMKYVVEQDFGGTSCIQIKLGDQFDGPDVMHFRSGAVVVRQAEHSKPWGVGLEPALCFAMLVI